MGTITATYRNEYVVFNHRLDSTIHLVFPILFFVWLLVLCNYVVTNGYQIWWAWIQSWIEASCGG